MELPRYWTRQPSGLLTLNASNDLSRNVTHLYTPTRRANVAGAGIAQTIHTTFNSAYYNGILWDVSGTTDAKGNYLPQSAAQVNLQLPWTLAALMFVSPNINNVSSPLINTGNTAGTQGTVWDRAIIVTFSSPNVFMRGQLYDGATKQVDHGYALNYSVGFIPFTVVISASNGNLRIFVNGMPAASETAISNNGYGGYSAGSTFLNWGDLNSTQSGYGFGAIVRTDGVGWLAPEAREFHRNPWQLFSPLKRRAYFDVPAAGGGVTVNLTGVSGTGSVGTTSETGAANVFPTGVSATGAIGTVSVSTGADISVNATGVSATGSVGTVSVTGGATASPTGVSATGAVGTATATGGATVTLSGTAATGAVGTVTVDTGGNVTVNTTGVSATGSVGNVTVTGDATVTLTGVSATGSIGTVSFGGDIEAPVISTVSAGTSGKGLKKRAPKTELFTVRIGTEEFNFLSMEAALSFLQESQPKVEEAIQKQAQKLAKRILKAKGKANITAKPKVVTITAPKDMADYVPLMDEVSRAVQKDFDNALSEILMAEAEVQDIMDIVRYL